MNTEKLERGNILAKSLIPKVDVLLSMSPKVSSGELADAIRKLSLLDMEFDTFKYHLIKLLYSYYFMKRQYQFMK